MRLLVDQLTSFGIVVVAPHNIAIVTKEVFLDQTDLGFRIRKEGCHVVGP